jgi:hypothetical protein
MHPLLLPADASSVPAKTWQLFIYQQVWKQTELISYKMTLSENPPFEDSIPLSSSHSMAPRKEKQKVCPNILPWRHLLFLC